MTDNTVLPGTGETIAAEEISGVKYQLMKLVEGTADSTTPVTPLTDTQLRAAEVNVGITNILGVLKHILVQLVRPIWINPVNGAIREVTNIAGGTIVTVSNVSSLNGMNFAMTEMLQVIPMRNSWNTSVRRNIT